MNQTVFCIPFRTPALASASRRLTQSGHSVTDIPTENTTHLLLGVPAFETDGSLKGGGSAQSVLSSLPGSVTVMGGNLSHPALVSCRTVDFLKDPMYLAENAAITAHCALRLLLPLLPATVSGMPILVIGWGRICKHLSSILKNLGAFVSVTSRRPEDRAMLSSLGYGSIDPAALGVNLSRFRVIINTAPHPVLDADRCRFLREDCVKIDLASKPGILCDNVLWARGLPGKYAPESAGDLIARTAIRLALIKE